MKKTYVILLSVLAWMLTACQQNEEVNNLLGNYTYKVSGVVSVDTIGDVHLAPETGTMTFTSTDKDDEVLMSFNHNGGDVYDIRAMVTKDSLYIRTTQRYIDVEVAQDTLLLGNVSKRRETFQIAVAGSGHMLSNGDVSFNLSYNGQAINDPSCLLSGKNIHLHCKRNAK